MSDRRCQGFCLVPANASRRPRWTSWAWTWWSKQAGHGAEAAVFYGVLVLAYTFQFAWRARHGTNAFMRAGLRD